MGQILDTVVSQPTVQVDWLTEFPVSTDPSTWVFPSYSGYGPNFFPLVCELTQSPNGAYFEVGGDWYLPLGTWHLAALAVSYRGNVLCIAPWNPEIDVGGGGLWPFQIKGSVQAVLF